MNINCLICRELFVPQSDVFSTECGHIFHYECLMQWLERSKTCPQCRSRTSQRTIQRIYFNIDNTSDYVKEDAGRLQSMVEDLQFEIRLKNKDLQKYTSECKTVKSQNYRLKDEFRALEVKLRSKDDNIGLLKEQLGYLKARSKYQETLANEIVELKQKLAESETVVSALGGCNEDFDNLLRSNHSVETLVRVASNLKKALSESDRRLKENELQLRRSFNSNRDLRADLTNKDKKITELEQAIEQLRDEKNYLRDRLAEHVSNDPNDTMSRIVFESPIPLSSRHSIPNQHTNRLDDQSHIDAPFLNLKTSHTMRIISSWNEKPNIHPLNPIAFEKRYTDAAEAGESYTMTFSGTGGMNKLDKFPSPSEQGSRARAKRPYTSMAKNATHKYRRLEDFGVASVKHLDV